MISERVREAVAQDLRDAVGQVESLGLWVLVGRGRVSKDDFEIVQPDAVKPTAVVDGARPKAARKAKAASAGGDSSSAAACEVCGAALPTGRGTGNRKVSLCKKHAGRWFVHRKRSHSLAFGAWVEHQKAGGGRRKKA